MQHAERLWWLKHSVPQDTAQTAAACGYPCESNSKCSSPGGLIVETGAGVFGESTADVDRLYTNCKSKGESARDQDDIFKVPDRDFTCSGSADGSFHPSKYCNVFHRCASGKRKDFLCPKAPNSPYELWWNDEKQQCEWPCLVNCQKPVFGVQQTAEQIQHTDALLNEDLCKRAPTTNNKVLVDPNIDPTNGQPEIYSKPISKGAHEPFKCPGIGYYLSKTMCNVYYDCKGDGQQPVAAFFCDNGHFDTNSQTCKSTEQVQCPHMPPLVYPYVATIVEPSVSDAVIEDIMCPTMDKAISYTLIPSTKYCNLYFVCDGQSLKPKVNRCVDQTSMSDVPYNGESKRCESAATTRACRMYPSSSRKRYQSIVIDTRRLPELPASLSCKADQQYLAEHENYCNLYHSCILGRYELYACIAIGVGGGGTSEHHSSVFHYTTGDCGAPSVDACPSTKSLFPYERIVLSVAPQQQHKTMSPSITQTGQTGSYGSMPLKSSLDSLLECDTAGNYIIPHKRFCNLFYECQGGKLKINACVDKSTNLLSGIFDKTTGKCKPYNTIDCPTGLVYNPESFAVDSTGKSAASTAQVRHNPNFLQVFSIPSFVTGSGFSCVGRANGYYESEWCNVFFRCINGKRSDVRCSTGYKSGEVSAYDLWWSHQNATYDAVDPVGFFGPDEEARCEFPCKVKCNKQIWSLNDRRVPADAIALLDIKTHPGCALAFDGQTKKVDYVVPPYRPYETDNVNPSGYFCDNDGTFKDPLFCNIFHVCIKNQRKTFICKQTDTDGSGTTASIYSIEQNACVSRADGLGGCHGIIYDPNFIVLPIYKNLPQGPKICEYRGVSRVQDGINIYCDLFYWCEKSGYQPIFFSCMHVVFGRGAAYYNQDKRQCDAESNVYCPFPNRIYANMSSMAVGRADVAPLIKATDQHQSNMMHVFETLVDPAPGLQSLAPFNTNFTCPTGGHHGYYPNPDYCDLFHYCYTNGQFKTYVCASMKYKYQLWWTDQTETGRRDVRPFLVLMPNFAVFMLSAV